MPGRACAEVGVPAELGGGKGTRWVEDFLVLAYRGAKRWKGEGRAGGNGERQVSGSSGVVALGSV